MCPGPAASGQHTGGAMLAERGLTLTGLEEQTGDWGDLAKTYDFTRIQCTFTHTHKVHQTLSGLHVYMAFLKKERLTPILGVLYISPSAVILLEDASCGNKFFYCIPIPFSPSTWEMCKVLPS